MMIFILFLTLLCPLLCFGAGNETVTPLPAAQPNASSYTQTRTFLRDEIPAVLSRYAPTDFVRAGGLHAPSGTMLSVAFATEAFTQSGNRVTADGAGGVIAIDYASAGCAVTDTAYVIISGATANILSNFARVGTSNYFVDCTSTSPPLPANAAWLMRVTISGGALTAVADLRKPSAFSQYRVLAVTDPIYGAIGDDVTDDTAALQAALNAARDQGGQTIYVPKGTYKTTAPLTIYQKTALHGDGAKISTIHAAHAGNAVESTWSLNSSTGVWIRLEYVGFIGDGGNIGAGFVDQGGSFVDIYATFFNAFKYGVIFDQTEVSTIDASIFDSQTLAGIWLVNGPDRTPTARENFTNRITITRNQFNHTGNTYNIIDDGGVEHVISNNNFNGGLTNLLACGLIGGVIQGNEFEGSTSTAFTLSKTTSIGTQHVDIISPSAVLIAGNVFAPVLGNIQIDFLNATSVTLLSNYFGSDALSPGRVKLTFLDTLVALGNDFRGGPSNGGTYTGGANNAIFLDGDSLATSVAIKPGISLPSSNASTGIPSSYLLNHYEEGSFTPTLVAGSSIFSYAVQSGHYIRIGKLVYVRMYIGLAGGNTLYASPLEVWNLPYAGSASTDTAVFNVAWNGFASAYTAIVGQGVQSESRLRLFGSTTPPNLQMTAVQGTDLNTGTAIYVTGQYEALN